MSKWFDLSERSRGLINALKRLKWLCRWTLLKGCLGYLTITKAKFYRPDRIYVTRCLGFNGALFRLSRATLQQHVLESSKILLQDVFCSSVWLSLATLKQVVIEFMKLNDPSNILLQSLFCVLLSDNTTHSQEFSVSATWAWILAIRQRRITAYVEFGPRLPKECWGRAGERNNVTIWCMCYS